MTPMYSERGPRNDCQRNARLMTYRYPELAYVEGYLVTTAPDGREYRTEHAWNVSPAGDIVDSTAWAFDGGLPYRYEADADAWPKLQRRVDELRAGLTR